MAQQSHAVPVTEELKGHPQFDDEFDKMIRDMEARRAAELAEEHSPPRSPASLRAGEPPHFEPFGASGSFRTAQLGTSQGFAQPISPPSYFQHDYSGSKDSVTHRLHLFEASDIRAVRGHDNEIYLHNVNAMKDVSKKKTMLQKLQGKLKPKKAENSPAKVLKDLNGNLYVLTSKEPVTLLSVPIRPLQPQPKPQPKPILLTSPNREGAALSRRPSGRRVSFSETPEKLP